MHNLALKREVITMTVRETWPSYVRRITQGLDRKAIAAAAGMNVSGVSRWLNEATRPSPEKVISFARGLHHSPIEALLAAGYLEDTDIGGDFGVEGDRRLHGPQLVEDRVGGGSVDSFPFPDGRHKTESNARFD